MRYRTCVRVTLNAAIVEGMKVTVKRKQLQLEGGGEETSHPTRHIRFSSFFIMLHFEGESFAMKSSRDE